MVPDAPAVIERAFSQSYSFIIAIIAIILPTIVYLIRADAPYPGIPLFGMESGEWTYNEAKKRYFKDATKIMKQGMEKFQGRPFQVVDKDGPIIVLHSRFADEIRNVSHLSFNAFTERDLFTSYPGFDAFRVVTGDSVIFQTVVRKNLTQALGGMSEDLSCEAASMLKALLPATKDWSSIKLSQITPRIAAQLSAKAFLGDPLCHNEDWLGISINYTVDIFKAARRLRSYPSLLRPFIYRFLPEVHTIQDHVKDARRIIEPEVIARRSARQNAKTDGKRTKATDAVGWMDEVASEKNQPFDIVAAQLLLSVVAIHTTSFTLMALLYDLTANQQYIDELREEIIGVLKEDGGWKKTGLYKMKLLDSCMKESQRLNVLSAAFMSRRAMESITLSDGTRIPKGAYLQVPTFDMPDGDRWGPNKHKFDGRRFLDLRNQPGQENRWQFVTTSAEHLGFGHGQHACPGRFFASNEIKIAIAHLLLKYDFKLTRPPPKSPIESEWMPDPNYTMLYKSRQPEIEL
ncbi:putative cytochrome p450 protein [Lasiodiplodia theobromae]|nr:putative cytochrome p450 protein [Lasiodiplodia theobromae]